MSALAIYRWELADDGWPTRLQQHLLVLDCDSVMVVTLLSDGWTKNMPAPAPAQELRVSIDVRIDCGDEARFGQV